MSPTGPRRAEDEELSQLQSLERAAGGTGLDAVPSIDRRVVHPPIVFDQTSGVNQPKLARSRTCSRPRARRSSRSACKRVADRRPAGAGDPLDPGGGADADSSARPTAAATPSAACRWSSHDLAGQISGAIGGPAGRRPRGDGDRALLSLPQPSAAAAAGRRAGRHRDHVRGCSRLAGASLTLASVAVLPVLIGLGGRLRDPVPGAARSARRGASSDRPRSPGLRRAAPTIATAALATATGFLVLLLSPVPMVQGFGLLLVAGIARRAVCRSTAVSAALRPRAPAAAAWSGPRCAGPVSILRPPARSPARGAGAAARGPGAARGARDWRGRQPRRRVGAARAAARGASRATPAACSPWPRCSRSAGWVADTQTARAVRRDQARAVEHAGAAATCTRSRRVTGVSGEIDVTVRGANVATPPVVGWMISYENQLLPTTATWRPGAAPTRRCARRCRCPTCSRPRSQATKTSRV